MNKKNNLKRIKFEPLDTPKNGDWKKKKKKEKRKKRKENENEEEKY